MPFMRWLSIMLFSVLVTACGGGGSIEKNDGDTGTGGGGSGSTNDYLLSLTIVESTNELSLATPLTIEATLTNNGDAVSNTNINFSTDPFARFDGASTALTNSDGKATIKILPTNQEGSGAVSATVSLSDTTINGSVGFTGKGDGGYRLSANVIDSSGSPITIDNQLGQTKTGIVRAVLLFDGNPLSGQTIDFQLDDLASTSGNSSVVTNNNGVADLSIQATKQVGAGSVIATFSDEQALASFTSQGNPFFGETIYGIALKGVDAETGETLTNLSLNTPIKLDATLTLNGQAIDNQALTFQSDGKAEIESSSVITNTDGVASTILKANETSGIGAINVTFTDPSGADTTSSFTFTSAGDGGLQLGLTAVDSEGNEINQTNPMGQFKNGFIEAVLTLGGQPLVGNTVVFELDALSSTNSNAKVQTNQAGLAVLEISATKLVGTASVSANYEQTRASIEFTSAGNQFFGEEIYTISLIGMNSNTGEPSSNLSVATPISLEASLKLNGEAASNNNIEFSSDTNSILGASSVLTDSEGVARTILTANTLNGSGVVNASFTTPSGSLVVQTFSYTSLGDGGIQMNISILDSAGNIIDQSNPLSPSNTGFVTVSIVEDQVPKSGAIIELDAGDEGSLDLTSRTTQANGEAKFELKPTTISGSGQITATYKGTIDSPITNGISKTKGYYSDGLQTTIDITINDKVNGDPITDINRIAENADALVTVVLKEGDSPLKGKFITIDAGAKGVTVPSDGRVVTDDNGMASLTLQANTEAGSEQLTATYLNDSGDNVVYDKAYFSFGNPNFDADPYKFIFVSKSAIDNQLSNQLSGENPLMLEAQLLLNNEAVKNTRVIFEVDEYARLDHSSGSILTNSQGVAEVRLLDNDKEGAGRVTVTFEREGNNLVASLDFNSDGTGGLVLSIVNIISTDNNQVISASNPINEDADAKVTVKLTENGGAINNAVISVENDAIITTRPNNGKTLTNIDGEAEFTLVPTTESGLAEFTVSYEQAPNVTITRTSFVHSDGRPVDDTANYNFDVYVLTGCNAGWDSGRDSAKLDPTSPDSGCTISSSVKSGELSEVYVYLTNKEQRAQPNEIVTVTSTVGQILPSSGKVLTDTFGVALLNLQPGNTGGAGTVTASFKGDSASSNFSVGDVDLIVTLDTGLEENEVLKAGGSTVIKAILSFKNEDTGSTEPYLSPIDVNFSSVCAASGDAQLDSTVKSLNGEARATYRAEGCSIKDPITVNVEAGGNNFVATATIEVDESPAQALRFLTTNDNFESHIALPPGIGGAPTLSVIEFQLLDEDVSPLEQKRIDFRLAQTAGSTDDAQLTQFMGSTDNEGKAQTTIKSGLVPGSIEVEACYIPDDLIDQVDGTDREVTCWSSEFDRCDVDPKPTDCPEGGYLLIPRDERIYSLSSGVTLSSGVPTQGTFDAFPTTQNINALDYIGATVDITIYFGDQFNQLSGDGVTATLMTEKGGVVGTLDGEDGTPLLDCKSIDASCKLTWRRQGDLNYSGSEWQNTISDVCDPYFGDAAPCIGNYPTTAAGRNVIQAGRISLLAIAKGQEYIKNKTDGLGRIQGLFEPGDTFIDLAEAFRDDNENGTYDKKNCNTGDPSDPCSPANSDGGENEESIDINNDGEHNGPNTIYNGLQCGKEAEELGKCVNELIDVRKQFDIVLSDDDPFVRFAIRKTQMELTQDTDNDGTSNTRVENTNCESVTLRNRDAASSPVPVDNDTNPITQLLEPITGHDDLCDIGKLTLAPKGSFNGVDDATVEIYFSDRNGNPLPAGTKVEITTNNGKLSVKNGQEQEILNTKSSITEPIEARFTNENDPNGDTTGALSVKFIFIKPDGSNKEVIKTLEINDAG